MFVSNHSRFFKAVHAFTDFEIAKTTIIKFWMILIDDFLWHVGFAHMKVLVVGSDHWCTKVKIVNVQGEVLRSFMSIGDNTIQVQFAINETNCRCTSLVKCI